MTFERGRLGSVLQQQTTGKRERCNQLALKWHFICISAALTIFTHVPDGGDSHPQTHKIFKEINIFIVLIYSFSLEKRSNFVSFFGQFFLELVSS